jgi:hypothetical protein
MIAFMFPKDVHCWAALGVTGRGLARAKGHMGEGEQGQGTSTEQG